MPGGSVKISEYVGQEQPTTVKCTNKLWQLNCGNLWQFEFHCLKDDFDKFVDFNLLHEEDCFAANGKLVNQLATPQAYGGRLHWKRRCGEKKHSGNENPPDKMGQCTSLPSAWVFSNPCSM